MNHLQTTIREMEKRRMYMQVHQNSFSFETTSFSDFQPEYFRVKSFFWRSQLIF